MTSVSKMRPMGWIHLALALVCLLALLLGIRPLNPLLVLLAAFLLMRIPSITGAPFTVTLERERIRIGMRIVELAHVTSIDREPGHVVIVASGERIRFPIMAYDATSFVPHAMARLEVVRSTLATRAERTAYEALLAHGTEAVIVKRGNMPFCLTLEQARTFPRHFRIFVRGERVDTYRTPHDPRIVAIVPLVATR